MAKNSNSLKYIAFIIIGLILLSIVGYYIYRHFKEPKVPNYEHRLEKENSDLKLELNDTREENDRLLHNIDSLMTEWRRYKFDNKQKLTKQKYETKRNVVVIQPIDSTISDLSKWLN